MNKTVIAASAAVIATVLGASGCGHIKAGDSAAAQASAKALATDPAVIHDKAVAAALAKKCLPVKANIVKQVKYARIFVAGKSSKYADQGKAERNALADCAGIPESQRPAFYDALKTSGVNALGEYVKGDHKAIKTWFLTTAPATMVKYQKKS